MLGKFGLIKWALATSETTINASIADRIVRNLNETASPLLMLDAIAKNPETDIILNNVQFIGVDNRFFKLYPGNEGMNISPGKALYRDGFEDTRPIRFRVDVPSGRYLVTVFLG